MFTGNTNYASPDRGFPGLVADLGGKVRTESYVQSEASAEIPFGVVVAENGQDTQGNQRAQLMVNGSSVVAGVFVHDHCYSKDIQLGVLGVKPTNMISVLKHGVIYVPFEGTTCTKGAQAFIRHTAGAGGSQKGAVRIDADTATAVVTKSVIFAETKTSNADGIVKVYVDVPLI